MLSARITVFVLFVSVIVFQHTEAWRGRRRRRRYQCSPSACEVSSWSSWSSCSANSCGQLGQQRRSRTISSQPSCGGAACPSLDETRQCYSSTPVNCQLSSWSEWSPCTASSCGERGTQSSSRHRIITEQCGGTCTSTFRKTKSCYSHVSVDCQLSSWSEWGVCAKTSTPYACKGIESSTRHKIMMEKCGGRCTYSFRKTRTCFAEGSSVDCQLGSWSEWSACTLKTCDVSSGVQFITRKKLVEEKCGGTCTSILRKSRTCLADFTCLNGGSLSGGSCLCAKGFSGACCEKVSSQGMYSQKIKLCGDRVS